MRSVSADDARRRWLLLATGVLLVVAWCAWAVLARISVYAISDEARIEVEAEGHAIAAPVPGTVSATRLAIGTEVSAGEVLLELDSHVEQLAHEEETVHAAALAAQIAVLASEALAEQRVIEDARGASSAALAEARARQEEAEAASKHAGFEAARVARLSESGQATDVEQERARSDAEQRRVTARMLALAIERLEWEQRTKESERRAHLEALARERAGLEGELERARLTVERLQREIEKRRVRAPIAGRVGESANAKIGAVVREGERLGTVVPQGGLRIVAAFSPESAIGRVRPGQRARLRLQAFPWAEYGSVGATVEHVADEVRAGRVRVELALALDPGCRIPLRHGLPGSVEVEVDRASPAELLLRHSGQLLAGPVGER
jgi:membrane fusion protein (multidrug efflux system)